MKPAPFAYAKARSVAHAIELLGDTEARLLAGGQSLIATLNMRLSTPRLLVDLNGVDELAHIARNDGMIEIGAMVRHAQAQRSPEIARQVPLLAAALPHIGHPAIRNRGTIGGSIAFADPAAELPACLLALGGEVAIAGPQGERKVRADDFFKGLFETALTAQDVLTAIYLPAAMPTAVSVLPNSPAATATTPWSGSRAAHMPPAPAYGICASRISASAARRCAHATPKPRWPVATSRRRWSRCATI